MVEISGAERTKMDSAERGNWQRLGTAIRKARIDMGYTNREAFADACNVSVRVLADIEAGSRGNFSDRVLGSLEEGLGWPAGTVDQIISDDGFQPPAPGGNTDLVFRPPAYNRRPVPVDVAVIERSIAALTEAHRASKGKKPSAVEAALASALVADCWPYVLRLLEDNCLPGRELHPAVRPLYEAFAKLSDWASPNDPSARYAQWLVGDAGEVPEAVRERHMQRWSDARRATRGRSRADAAEADAVRSR